jgi:outer membrane translocation and assembly module TamA
MAENSLPPVIEPVVKRKEDDLIERFIIKEPHIHPPSSDKLDTENKAKKSSEDADVLVTETLAKIYLDQMLYHKALDTYKKLLLKFPEKNRYFTAQIELIENKIN